MLPTDILQTTLTYTSNFPLFSALTASVLEKASLKPKLSDMPDMPNVDIDNMSEEALKAMPEDERLMQAAQAAKASAQAQGYADSLRAKAKMITDPKERERMVQEAYDNEVKANGMSRKAKFLKSGTFQGAAGGAGIGGVVGMGLGTVVGTLVGTVATIPTTAVGGLIGTGVGAIHGPFIKLGGDKKKGEKDQVVQVPQAEIDNGSVVVDEKTGQVKAKDPEELKKAAAAAEQAAQISKAQQRRPTTRPDGTPRKPPKKLEVRGKPKQEA